MGLGGLITGIMGATGNSPTINTPDTTQVGQDFAGLLQAYLNKQPDIFANEAQYQPKYTQLGLQDLATTRTANINQGWADAPRIKAVMNEYDPAVTSTLNTLNQQAQAQLRLNGALDPNTQRTVEQATRTSQAARGLGYGPGDAAQEQYYLTQTQEQRRAQNQQFASQVAGQTANYYGDPFSKMLGISQPVTATPQIMSSAQSDSMLGTTYNARAAANIGNANTQTAMLQGFNSFF